MDCVIFLLGDGYMDKKSTIGLSSTDFPLENFIKAGYNTILPRNATKRTGYSSTMYYIISGQLKITVNGALYQCDKNSIIHLYKDDAVTIHNPSHTQKAEIYYLLFELKEGITMDSMNVERVTYDTDGKMYTFCNNIYKAYLSESIGYKLKIASDFLGLLYMLVTKGNTKEENVNYKLAKAVSHIKMNYYKNLSVEELSEISGYSVSHFRRLLLNHSGMKWDALRGYKFQKPADREIFLSAGLFFCY